MPCATATSNARCPQRRSYVRSSQRVAVSRRSVRTVLWPREVTAAANDANVRADVQAADRKRDDVVQLFGRGEFQVPPGGVTSHLDPTERAEMGGILQCLDVGRSQIAVRVFGSPARCRLDVDVRVRFRVVAVVVRVDSTGATDRLAPLVRGRRRIGGGPVRGISPGLAARRSRSYVRALSESRSRQARLSCRALAPRRAEEPRCSSRRCRRDEVGATFGFAVRRRSWWFPIPLTASATGRSRFRHRRCNSAGEIQRKKGLRATLSRTNAAEASRRVSPRPSRARRDSASALQALCSGARSAISPGSPLGSDGRSPAPGIASSNSGPGIRAFPSVSAVPADRSRQPRKINALIAERLVEVGSYHGSGSNVTPHGQTNSRTGRAGSNGLRRPGTTSSRSRSCRTRRRSAKYRQSCCGSPSTSMTRDR